MRNEYELCIFYFFFVAGYDDEYILEDIEITLGDQIQRVNKVNFGSSWEEAVNGYVQKEDTYALTSMRTLEEAVKNIVQFLGLMPAERSDKVPEGKTMHSLFLAGTQSVRISFGNRIKNSRYNKKFNNYVNLF